MKFFINYIIYFFLIFSLFIFSYNSYGQEISLQRAIQLFNTGKEEEAKKLLDQIILRNPNNAQAYYYQSLVCQSIFERQGLAESEKLLTALAAIEQAIAISPTDAKWYLQLAKVYVSMDKFNLKDKKGQATLLPAINAYEKTIELDKEGHHWIARYDLGIIYFQQKNYALAIDKLLKALSLSRDNPKILFNLSESYFNNNNNNEAIDKLNYLISLKTSTYQEEAYLLLAEIYRNKGEYQKAKNTLESAPFKTNAIVTRLEELRKLVDRIQQITDLIAKGELCEKAKEYESAYEQYKRAAMIDTGNQKIISKIEETKRQVAKKWFEDGNRLLDRSNWKSAIIAYNKALEFADLSQMRMIIQQWEMAQQQLGGEAKMYKVYKDGQNAIISGKLEDAIHHLEVAKSEINQPSIPQTIDTLNLAAQYAQALKFENIERFTEAWTYYYQVWSKDSSYRDINFKIDKINGDRAFEDQKWREAETFYRNAKTKNFQIIRTQTYRDGTSVEQRLQDTIAKRKRDDLFSFIYRIIIPLFILIIGYFTGRYILNLYYYNKKKYIYIKISFIKYLTFGKIILFLIFILFFIFIYFYNYLAIKLFYLLDKILVQIIYSLIFTIFMGFFVGMIPVYLMCNFNNIISSNIQLRLNTFSVINIIKSIYYEPIHFIKNPFYFIKTKKNIYLNLFKNIQKIDFIKFYNIKNITFEGNSIVLKDKKKQILKSNIVTIEPNTTDYKLNLVLKEENDYSKIMLKNFQINSMGDIAFQKTEFGVTINFGKEKINCKHILKNYFTIYNNFNIHLDNGLICGTNYILPSYNFEFQSSNLTIHFELIPEISKIEFGFSHYPIQLIEDLSGSDVSFIDYVAFLKWNNFINTITSGKIETPIGSIPEKAVLSIDNSFLARPTRFNNLSIEVNNDNFCTSYTSKVKHLKTGSIRSLSNKLNEVPGLLVWLWSTKKTFMIILSLIAFFTSLFLQPYLENKFANFSLDITRFFKSL